MSDWIEARSTLRQEHYRAVLDSEDRIAPEGNMKAWQAERGRETDIGPEVDEWVHSPMSHEVAALLDRGEDFALADELHQRLFLILAAEVLYGPRHDAVILAFAIMEAFAYE